MELPSWAAYFTVALATTLFLKTILSRGRRTYNLPPGPKPWPIIGNLHLMGQLSHRSIHAHSKQYGPLMQLWFGSVPVVVGSSLEMAKFFLKTHDATFADRPKTAAGKYMAYGYSDLVLAAYGPYWRQARRICAAELFSARRLESLEHVRGEEVRALLRNLSKRSGQAVRLRDYLQMMTLNAIFRMVLGKKYVGEEAEGAEFMELLREFFVLNAVFNIGDFVSWLGWLDLQGYVRRMKRTGRMFDRFLERVVEEHNERRRVEGDAFVARDMLDVLLQLADDPNLEAPLSRDNVKAITQDLLMGATIAMTVEWAMSELLKNPKLLAKATEELDNVIGRDRLVTERDLPHVPYLNAVLQETLRVHPPAPMLAPHLSREDTSINGYAIPAGTTVLVNVWAIARDPALWDAPEEFRPDRFVGSEIDVKGQHFELLPFGSGRRICPGLGLGLKMLMLSLANLLRGFAWRLPDGVSVEELSMEETNLLATPRKVPLEAVVEPSLPTHLYTDA